MADESKQGNSGGGQRRRYFRRKPGDKTPGDKAPGEQAASGATRPAQPRAEGKAEGKAEDRPEGRPQRRSAGRGEPRSEPRKEPRKEPRAVAHPDAGRVAGRHEPREDHAAMLEKRSRNVRRRRKGKSRRPEGRSEAAPIAAARDPEYVPPKDVYIYTHTVRPAGTGAYEFRSEHFSRVGHTLDDYSVDISSLFKTVTREERDEAYTRYFADFDYGEEADPAQPPVDPQNPIIGDGEGETPA